MAADESLFKALDMFTEGVKSLQMNRSLSQANDTVAEIKRSELNEQEQMKAIRGVADDLTLRLVGGGVPASSIDQVRQAFGSGQQQQQFQQQMALAGVSQAGQNARQLQQQSFTSGESKLNREAQLKAAGIKAEAQAKQNGKLEVGLVKDLQKYDTQLVAGEALMETLKAGLAKPGLENMPVIAGLKAMNDPKFAGFQSQTNAYFDAYRLAVTGMSAGPGELENLKKVTPNVNDTPKQFQAKLKAMMKIGNKVRTRFLQNLKKSGRNVDEFLKPGSGTEVASADQVNDFNASAGADMTEQAPAPTSGYQKYFGE